MRMKRISHEAYLLLRERSEVVSKDPYGDKVLDLQDGSMLKLFRIRNIISTARIYPYSSRFVHNAESLAALGIPTVRVVNQFRIPSIKRTAVQYIRLGGVTLAQYFDNNRVTEDMAQTFGCFIASVHNKGIYFRSIHFGNIIVLPDQGFGFIDVSDMKTYGKALSPRMRLKNFNHLTRYELHLNHLQPEAMTFIQTYLKHSQIPTIKSSVFKKRLLKHFEIHM